MVDRFSLEGRRALVTGASRGIGLGIARGLAEAGADVVLLARNRDALEQARAGLADTGREIGVVAYDLLDAEGIPALYTDIVEQHGAVDILVNNAGFTHREPAETVALEDWQRTLDLNLTAAFALSQAFARERIASGCKGKIINITSINSEGVRPTIAPYVASKGALKQLTKSLAVDWAKHGINVNAIGPGFIRTELTAPLHTDPEFDAWVKQRTPWGRWGEPDDIAGAAVFLASDAADFVTGTTLYVDGGWLAAF